ncbi:MAG TPA: arginine--tRNA ligase, partial [Chlamydiales bacterium]|nr:arginine--tRNA ligase [Chlamydiales bacterium]
MSQSIHHRLLHLFTKAAHTAFETFADVPLEVAKSQDPKFGQYQFNSAMKLGQYFRQNPRKIAEAIVAAMEPDEAVEKLEIAGPGFINIWLKKEFLQNALSRQLNDPKLLAHAESPQRIIIDFSSPNIAKQMHVGHLRTTIIGESLARVFEFLGHDVLRLNHVGDWGTSFGMLIAYMKENNTVSQEALEKVTLDELMAFYKASKVKFDADEGFKKRAQLEVVALQNGNEEAIRIWKAI